MLKLMISLRYMFTFGILNFTILANGQTFDRTYQGWWASPSWTFNFNSDGTYNRISSGHYGNTSVTGNYNVYNDTIQLFTNYKNTIERVNEKFLIENDSLIIDLEILYDYKLITLGLNYYNSKMRYDILEKPNMDSLIIVTKLQFEAIVDSCISILKTLRIFEIKKIDNIKIIRSINTINMSQDTSFKKGIYAEFMKLVKEKDYEKEISFYFFDRIPSRGMGFYFQKLQVELGGTPHLFSKFTIK